MQLFSFSTSFLELYRKLTQHSEYSFTSTSTPSTLSLFAFSQGENASDLLTSSAWCLPEEAPQYLADIHDHGSAPPAEIEDSLFTSGQATPRGARNTNSLPMEAMWNTARTQPAKKKSHEMSRMNSSTSGCSAASHRSSVAQTNPMVETAQAFQDDAVQVIGTMQNLSSCQISDSVGSPTFWPGYGLDIGMNGDCALTVEDINSMNVAPTQVSMGLQGLSGASPSSSWDVSSSISRTSSPNTIDESWRAAAMANSPMTFMGDTTRYVMNHQKHLQYAAADSHIPSSSPENRSLALVSDMQDSMVPLTGDMSTSAAYKQRGSVDSDSPRDDALYKNVTRGPDGLFHCPWENKKECNHKPEKLKCNYEYVPFQLS